MIEPALWLLLATLSQDATPTEPATIPLNIADAVALALRENYDIRSATINRVAQRYAVLVAHDRFRPHVSLNSNIGATTANTPVTMQTPPGHAVTLAPHGEIILPTGTFLAVDLQQTVAQPPLIGTGAVNSGVVLTASQPLLRNFGIDVNLAAVNIADMQDRINRLGLRGTVINTVNNVILAYRNFTQASLLLQISKKAVSRSQELLDINLQLVAAGRMARAELIQVESELATREVNQVTAESNYITFQIALLQLLAMSSDAPIAPVAEPVVDIPTPPLQQARQQALANRPEYLAVLVNEDIAHKNLLVAENNRLWDLALTAQYRRGGVDNRVGQGFIQPVTGPGQSFFVGLTLNVPLLEVLREQQVINSAVSVSTTAVAVAQVRNNIQLDVDAACHLLDLRRRHLALAKRARELAEKKLANERERLSAGRSSNFQVLRFQDDLVNSEIVELQTSIAYLNAVTNLRVRLGSLLDAWDIKLG